jgi:bifunctional non-homologous end joining protein LigD
MAPLPLIGIDPPFGPGWVHEIKRDGFRLMARRDGAEVRRLTRRGNDWTQRYSMIVEALACLRSRWCILDWEAVCCDDNGMPSFDRQALMEMARPFGGPSR